MTEPQQVLARLSADFVTMSQQLTRASAELTQLAGTLGASAPAAAQPPAQPSSKKQPTPRIAARGWLVT